MKTCVMSMLLMLFGTLARADDTVAVRLLARLHQAYSEGKGRGAGAVAEPRRESLESLRGLQRAQLESALGTPDFCVTARHCAYFFFAYRLPAVQDTSSGTTVSITVDQGWSMEVHFSDRDVIEKAAWVNQH